MGPTAPLSSDNTYRFEHFEADRERYQLRSDGRAVKLERIPLELLFLLLANQGKLVSREQIAAALWKDHSFLDTERSINTAVRKIRKVLGDDPHRQRFIETVVGKGYRFAAPIATGPQQVTRHEIPPLLPIHAQTEDLSEVSFKNFQVEAQADTPTLTCTVTIGGVCLGRLPIATLELPLSVEFPLTANDRLRLQIHGVGTQLTAKASQALQGLCLAILQRGLRTRATDLISSPQPASPAELQDRASAASAKSASV